MAYTAPTVLQVLRAYFQPNKVTLEEFAIEIGVDIDFLHEVVIGESRMDWDLAERFVDELGRTTPEFWMQVDEDYHNQQELKG